MSRAPTLRRRPTVTADLGPELHPLLARLYAARGVRHADEVRGALDGLVPPDELGNTAAAAELLHATMQRGGTILIVGDYDADGATASALAVLGLRRLGAPAVDYLVPNRFETGYGLTPPVVELARARRPALIVTVDNGIASHEGVAVANALGIPVLVTDHHLPGDSLPAAACIVNPNLRGDPFPSKALAGVGVMFYVLLALRRRLRAVDWFASRGLPAEAQRGPNLAELLDLVALGTVADVAKLDRNNRILVAAGLARLRAGRGRPGIEALARIGKRDPRLLTARDLGFTIGPRLNAAGRMEDMSIGIELLLADDPAKARALAARLDEINQERRAREGEMREDAFAAVDRLVDSAELPFGVCLHQPNWHEGLVGLVASRVRERTHRPVFAFAASQDGKLKGSGRSVDGFHLRDAVATIATREPDLIERFGGHAMAAGLTLPAAHFARFAAAFDAVVREQLDEAALTGVVVTDGTLEPEWHTPEAARLLRGAGPWGNGFPEPVFEGEFTVNDTRVVGGRHLRLGLRPAGPTAAAGEARALPAIAFGWDEALPPTGTRLRVVYQLELDTWREPHGVQLLVLHADPVA